MKNTIFYAKIAVWLTAFAPLVRLVWLGLHNDLGANPIEFIEHSTGLWALIFLLASLGMTPIRLLTGHIWQIQLRRLLGLWMFAYACLHVAAYLWLDFAFMWDEIWQDIAKHPRILLGFAAFVLAIPLAATSTQAAMKRLKGRWKTLHQSVYLLAILAVLHFLWLVKKDVTEPLYYTAILMGLLAIRIYFKYIKQSLKR